MKNALVVGGGSGIGLAMTVKLLKRGYEKIYIVGKDAPDLNDINVDIRKLFEERVCFKFHNLADGIDDCFDDISDIDTLIITAGFGRVAAFESLADKEVDNLINVNMLSNIRIIKKYYGKILSDEPFYCAVMGSIAGHLVSPLFSVYGASKAGLCSFIENVNTELAHNNVSNRILDVSPGSLKGTKFSGGENSLSQLDGLCDSILEKMYARECLFIPDYETIYKGVLERYNENPLNFGLQSCEYKKDRISDRPQLVVGYLSGTFDLFHIGHLNLIKRAKKCCDYLIVGVHESGARKGKETYIPFSERQEIVRNIKQVDRVVTAFSEDSDAYDAYKFDKLFVGSDYKGTERFNRYEEYFADKNVEIVYFPYTKQTAVRRSEMQ